jgi:ketosteroid isomerase-like protein
LPRFGASVAVLAALAACSGCAQPEEGVPADLKAAMDEFYASVEAGDGEARIALFADDAIMMPNHWTMSRGKKSIAGMIRGGEGYVFRLRDREIVDIDVRSAMAYTVNSYYYTYHAEGAEPQWHKTKNVHIWKRDAEGSWKLHVDIWNSDVPMSEFPNE